MSKTREDVDRLKANWLGDPACYDLEDVEGFEEYRDELVAFRKAWEARWEAERNARILGLAAALGCSPQLVRYIEGLERQLERMAEEIRKLGGNL